MITKISARPNHKKNHWIKVLLAYLKGFANRYHRSAMQNTLNQVLPCNMTPDVTVTITVSGGKPKTWSLRNRQIAVSPVTSDVRISETVVSQSVVWNRVFRWLFILIMTHMCITFTAMIKTLVPICEYSVYPSVHSLSAYIPVSFTGSPEQVEIISFFAILYLSALQKEQKAQLSISRWFLYFLRFLK